MISDTGRDSDRLRRLARLFTICNLLDCRGPKQRITLDSLAVVCGCNARTISRDLNFLREAGIAVDYDSSQRSFVLQQPLPFPKVSLSLPEIMALSMARQSLAQQASTPFSHAVEGAFEKLMAKLPHTLRTEFESAHQHLFVAEDARRDYRGVPWQKVWQALQEQKTAEMTYHSLSRDRISSRRIDAYGVIERQGYWNLVGYCHTRQEVRQFAIDSIYAFDLTQHSFERPADFSIENYLRGSVGLLRGETTHIVVRFEAAVSRWAKRRNWNFPFEITEEADDSVLLHGQVSGLEEITKELLRWGALVTALEPKELRQRLHDEAQAIVQKYADEAHAENR